MTFHVPPANQGQIVEISYAMIDGVVIRRIYDRSDGSRSYATSKAHLDDEADYWNGEPTNVRWRNINEQEFQRIAEGE